MTTIAFVRNVANDSPADQRLYKLSEPVSYGYEEDKGTTTYVIVSGTHVPFSGPETYIFPADEIGHVIDWMELPGSFRGSIDHERAIANAGWTLIEDGSK